ncbi:MAG: glycosyltransferase family 4 protein [Candidatus Mcinerneyibacterium aminivorans]|uniref:Glycosyltransferase family 4 protein n=1 Tax=Candidatus Mcinerneyibacterium aminivorans TaxID=2703815 RepID=A0A5D0MG46_9BACT|nr:MAG: glycosyltransferase family 4 protein [Candidatus Mcinerneyibacterium aminivorans]
MKKALLIVYSNHTKDNRIRKHKHFLKNAGYKVDIIGFEKQPKSPSFLRKIIYILMLIINKEKAIEYLYGFLKYDINKNYDLIIANDWNTLPIAFKFKDKNNILVYDSHEYAIKLATENLKWRILICPLTKYIERKYILSADLVTTVSSQIAREYEKLYNISEVIVLRNIPLESDRGDISIKTSKTKPIKLYHHGHYLKLRKLDKIIEIVKSNKKFELYLRLIGEIKNLKNKYRKYKNIIFHEPLQPEELVEDIKNYDLGIALQPPYNKNRVYSLPNKFFDFIFGGVPVVVCNNTKSMAEFVKKYDIGFIARDFSYESIKTIFKKITIEEINQKKNNLLKAQKELSAGKEWEKLIKKIKEFEDKKKK